MPKVSIITPCYNAAAYVDATIDSAQAQTLHDWEMVIVDDGSTDDSAGVVRARTAGEPRLHLICKPNGGVSSARNTGYRWCTSEGRSPGEYLLFLDSDDVMEPTMLETMANHLDTHSDVGLVYCRPRLIGVDGVFLEATPESVGWAPRYAPTPLWVRRMTSEAIPTPFTTLFAPTTIIPSVSLIRSSVYADTPGFDEPFGHLFEDLDLFLQIALRSQVHHLPKPLLRYRRHPTQSTSNIDKVHSQEQKMYAKWQALLPSLPPEQARLVKAGFQFRNGRIAARDGFAAAGRHLRRGEWVPAARFAGGALRRYLPTIFSPPSAEI